MEAFLLALIVVSQLTHPEHSSLKIRGLRLSYTAGHVNLAIQAANSVRRCQAAAEFICG